MSTQIKQISDAVAGLMVSAKEDKLAKLSEAHADFKSKAEAHATEKAALVTAKNNAEQDHKAAFDASFAAYQADNDTKVAYLTANVDAAKADSLSESSATVAAKDAELDASLINFKATQEAALDTLFVDVIGVNDSVDTPAPEAPELPLPGGMLAAPAGFGA